MRKAIIHIVILMLTLLSNRVMSQAPQGIPYQAVARNSSGSILAGVSVSLRFTIRDITATGAISYRETHHVTTTTQGLFSVNVGNGTPVTGTIAGINWGTGAKFLQVEIDPDGDTNYIDMGTQQLMSVPYSMYSNNGVPAGSAGDILYHNGTTWARLPTGTPGQVLRLNASAMPVWSNCDVPTVLAITGSSSVLMGGTISLSVGSSGGAWSSNNTAVATVGTNGVVTGVAAGTTTISYTLTNVCGSAASTYDITVNAVPLVVGSTYGGGKIAYVFQPGDAGYIAGEIHGFIVSLSDFGPASIGCIGTSVPGASGTAIGSGAANTAALSATCGSGGAARICADLVLGGYDDWCLPSRYELQAIYSSRMAIGGIPISNFLSSSEWDSMQVWSVSMLDGTAALQTKFISSTFRAIRYF